MQYALTASGFLFAIILIICGFIIKTETNLLLNETQQVLNRRSEEFLLQSCGRKKPTEIFLNIFIDQSNKILKIILGRNGKDFAETIITEQDTYLYINLENGWQSFESLPKNKQKEVEQKLLFSKEEIVFFQKCFAEKIKV